MKKIKLISLGALVFGIASFIAYSNGAIASENSNDSEVSNKTIPKEEVSLKNIKLNLDGLEIFKDFSIPITEKEGVREILTKEVGKVLRNLNRDSESTRSMSYTVVHEGDKLSFINIKVVEEKLDNKQGDAPLYYDDCPDGLELIKICYDDACVQETLRELLGHFSRGETIHIRHDGFGGIIICSDA